MPAEQLVYHDEKCPPHVLLPVIPNGDDDERSEMLSTDRSDMSSTEKSEITTSFQSENSSLYRSEETVDGPKFVPIRIHNAQLVRSPYYSYCSK